MRRDVLDFLAAADIYQRCLADSGDHAKLARSQAAKERVGREFNSLVRALKTNGN